MKMGFTLFITVSSTISKILEEKVAVDFYGQLTG